MTQDIYDKVMTLAKRRGYIYPSFEIYGGVAGFYSYGPLGTLLKHNIEDLWRKIYVLQENCIEIDTPTITPYDVLKASGHVDEFTDLTVNCSKCKKSYKIEDIIDKNITVKDAIKNDEIRCPTCGSRLQDIHPVNLMFSTIIGSGNGRQAFLRPETAQGIFTDFHLLYRHVREKIPFGVIQIGRGYRNEISPRQGVIRLREFSMAEAEIFFDPLDKNHPKFDNVKDKKLYIFDNKKEMHISLEEALEKKIIRNQALAYYMYITQEFLLTIGIDPKRFRFRKHAPDELAHYATECWDAEVFSKRFGWIECVGIADRSAYDINAHIQASGTDMHALRKLGEAKTVEVKRIIPKMDTLGPLFKEKAGRIKKILENMKPLLETNKITVELDGKTIEIPENCYEVVKKKEKITGEKFIPHVIEPSYGIDRIFYCILEHNYVETKKKGEKYHVLRLSPLIAPIKTGVFPLTNDEKLVRIAREVDQKLRKNGIVTYYDDNGSIGRRYARMDEIGTPFCITIDHNTTIDNTVTIRDRDTTRQERKKIEKLPGFFKKHCLIV
ncbi:MAG: glycine--tRNA ligase [Thermoplasmata archaeon]|nr:MAG: glycine--tRNA ligase [Thermoplasmata archaeon]